MPHEMPDVIVLLPGITGSVLKKDGKVIWGYSASSIGKALVTKGASWVKKLEIQEDDPAINDLGDGVTVDTLMPDLHLLPGVWKIDGYSAITKAITGTFEVTEGKNLFTFPYDWRRDNRFTSRKLAEASRKWLADWRSSSGNGEAKLILLAHSMGGLVCRHFLECMEGWKDTKVLVTFGTPYRGSLNALDGLANGLKKGPLELSELARQLTSMYQLLPVFRSYDRGDGNLVRVGETSGIPNVNFKRAASALAFHHEIKDAQLENSKRIEYRENGYDLVPVVGIAQQTSLSARKEGTDVKMLRVYDGKDLGGDGTVPRISAIPIEMSDEAARAMYVGTKHGSLQNAEHVLRHLMGVLTGFQLDLGSFMRPEIPIALEVDDLYGTSEDIEVRARPSDGNSPLFASVRQIGTGAPFVTDVRLAISKDGWHHVTLPSLPGGAYRIVVAGEGLESVGDSFAVVEDRKARGRSERSFQLEEISASRRIRLDYAREPAGAREFENEAPAEREAAIDLGATRSVSRGTPASGDRGGGRRPSSLSEDEVSFETPEPEESESIRATLSAETDSEIEVGKEGTVFFEAELADEARPLSSRFNTDIDRIEEIVITLSLENENLELVSVESQKIKPPTPGEPRTGFFKIKALSAGICRVAVRFSQGGTDLGVISLVVTAVKGSAQPGKADGISIADPRDFSDDDKLTLLVKQRTENGKLYYEYTLHSEALGFPYREYRSKPILDRGEGSHKTVLAYILRIYGQLTRRLESNWDDLKNLQREVRALGVDLCEELFEPGLIKELWPVRDKIHMIQVVSWEPYIPWELLRLCHPESHEIDDRFLAEYGLIRTLTDVAPCRALPLKRWKYLGAIYPSGSLRSVGSELDFFEDAGDETLQGYGIVPELVNPEAEAFYNTLEAGEFDVLHLACHAEAEPDAIDRASLIIGEDTIAGNGGTRLIRVGMDIVSAEANWTDHHPLIFLNACETGRSGPLLTAWGGWPNVFLRCGAAAFVGSSWAVRDKPAGWFAGAFYESLLNGYSLAEAATAARRAARFDPESGKEVDASWLAFKVYGHPRAKGVRQ